MSIERMEKIKIIFSLDDFSDVTESAIGNIVFSGGKRGDYAFDLKILGKVFYVLDNFYSAINVLEQGRKISIGKFFEKIKKEEKRVGKIELEGFSIRFGRAASMHQAFLIIEQKKIDASMVWERWVSPFLSEENFVQAWVSDVEFDFWQNATDLLEYEVAGVSYMGLPLRSNGLPPPLEEMEVDVSQNPGRWSLNKGFVEAIGTSMWLGPLFWNYVGDRREKLKSVKWLRLVELSRGVIFLEVPGIHFFDLSTAHIQYELRKILYA